MGFDKLSIIGCGTGCRDPRHMFMCIKCGAEFHKGIVHHCSTGESVTYWR